MQAAQEQERDARLQEMDKSTSVTLSTIASTDDLDAEDGLRRMNVLIKADGTGSTEAVKGALMGLPQDTISLRFLLAATGPITESDVDLAYSTEGFIVAFNVDISDEAEAAAKQRNVDISQHQVIYNVLDDVCPAFSPLHPRIVVRCAARSPAVDAVIPDVVHCKERSIQTLTGVLTSRLRCQRCGGEGRDGQGVCCGGVAYGCHAVQVRQRMEGRIKEVTEKEHRGTAEVKAMFGRGKTVSAGCLVKEGRLMNKGVLEVHRGKELVWEGAISSLRRFKDEVPEVKEGVECGVNCAEFWKWEEGDRLEFYELVQKKLSLEESHADTAMDFDTGLEAMQEEYEEAKRRLDAGEPEDEDEEWLQMMKKKNSRGGKRERGRR